MLTGENGILTQAQNAKEETENAQANETNILGDYEDYLYNATGDVKQVDDNNPGVLEGSGTEQEAFVINSIEDLVVFADNVTKGTNNYQGQYVELGLSLDFNSDKSYVDPDRTDYVIYGYDGNLKQLLTTGEGFIPIGSQDGTNSFYGMFDGNNNVICSLYENISRDADVYAGLFSNNYGEIRNLGIINTSITVKGETTSIAGIAGCNYNNIYNCYVTGNIEVKGNHWMSIGGISGVSSNKIENCYNLASIECENTKEDTGNSSLTCGGIIGQVGTGGCDINRCFNKGKITINGGNNSVQSGGICGKFYLGNNKSIRNSYNKGKVESSSKYIVNSGGIAGELGNSGESFSIVNCYNSGQIAVNATETRTSGILGLMASKDSNISNVFNIGKILLENGKYESSSGAGGILGVVIAEATNSSINNAHNTGAIELKNTINQNIGSVAGYIKDSLTLSDCYFLTGTYDVGIGYGKSTGVTKVDTMNKSVLEVVNGENAFKADTNNINNGYPILEWQ